MIKKELRQVRHGVAVPPPINPIPPTSGFVLELHDDPDDYRERSSVSAFKLRVTPLQKGKGMSDNTMYLRREKRFLVLLGLICLAMIGGALYLQVVLEEAPCPLCILQRYALLFIAIFAFIGAAMPGRRSTTVFEALVVFSAIGGCIAAGRHAYILAHPTESCGVDVLQPIVDGLPLAKWFPLGFQVDGFCITPYPPILGLSLAQWALVAFVLTVVLVPLGILSNRRKAV
jgi:disulfide bond formation protein DsbB